MEPSDQALLADNIDLLMTTRNIDSLIEDLLNRKVLSHYMVGQFKMIPTEEQKVRAFYEELQSRGPSAFEHLLSALAFTDNEIIANTLNQKKYGTNSQYKKIKVINSGFRQDLGDEDSSMPARVYHMGSKPKGFALVININKFFDHGSNEDSGLTRYGSYRDVANIYTLLYQLGYEVMLHYDLTKKEIKKKVTNFAEMPQHASVDSTIVVIMSHGRYNSLLSYDKKEVHCDRDVVAPFNSNRCQHLQGKPKIFVFQMCRGEELDFGIDVGAVSPLNGSSTTADSNRFELPEYEEVADENQTRDQQLTNNQPSINNIFQIHATSFDYKSLRDPITGSFFVCHMCDVFAKYAYKWELSDLVRETAKCVTAIYDQSHGFMTPYFSGSADFGKFYFNPGLYDEESPVSNS